MKQLREYALHASGMALFGAMLLTVWACDFEFDVQVGGKGVDVSSISGTADSIAARLRVGGKSCKVKRTISGVVGPDGCITITGTLCGQTLDEKICGLQPRSEYQYTIEVDGGGMVVLQVPDALADLGSWRIENGAQAGVASIEFSDRPFGYVPLRSFVPQPGKRIVYARYHPDFSDSLVDGDLVGALRQSVVGLDTVKFILAGQLRLRTMPGGPRLMAADSNFVFAEMPRTYDFVDVGAPFAFQIHFVGLRGRLLTDAEVRSLDLSGSASRKYAAVYMSGATSDQIKRDYRLFVPSGDSIIGAAGLPVVLGSDSIVPVAFNRAQFFGVVDSTRPSTSLLVRAELNTISFPWTVTFPMQFTASTGIGQDESMRMQLSVTPNVAADRMTAFYHVSRSSEGSLGFFDVKGALVRLVRIERQAPGPRSLTVSTAGLAAGVYLLELRIGQQRGVARVTITK